MERVVSVLEELELVGEGEVEEEEPGGGEGTGLAAGGPARTGWSVAATLIRAGVSRNGYRYTPDVLRASLPLWEGAHVYVDHPGPGDQGRAGGRSVRDLAGVVSGVRYDEVTQSVRGTIRWLPTAEWLRDLVRSFVSDRGAGRPVPRFGLSGNLFVRRSADGSRGGRETYRVEAIERVDSVDVVCNPSAGGRFDWILESTEDGALRESEIAGPRESGMTGPRDGRMTGFAGGGEADREGGRDDREQRFESARRSSSSNGESRLPEGGNRIVTQRREGGPQSELTEGDAGVTIDGTGVTRVSEGTTAPEHRAASTQQGATPPEGRTAVKQEEATELAQVGEAAAALGEAQRALEAVRQMQRQMELERSQLEVARLIGASGLPEAAQQHLRGQLTGRVYEAAEVEQAIGALRSLVSAFTGLPIRGVGLGRPELTPGATGLELFQAAVDGLFGVALPEGLRHAPRLSGIREAYIQATGDTWISGQLHPENVTILEANEVTTGVMANVVGTSMNKRLVADYRGQIRWWEPFVIQVDVRDMRQQERVLLNDFASLGTVNENAAYVNIAWDDNKESYTPIKKGGLVYVTMETIINDDLRAVTHIPTKLARAATVTINEYVANLFMANGGAGPAMADGFNVFDAVNHQGNSTTSALSSTSVQAALVAMAKFTNTASKRIGIRGRYLLVPPDLIFTAQVIAKSSLVAGSANNDLNILQGIVEPIESSQFTDTNNWYLLADPRDVEYLELGFLQGRREPELLLQDSPTVGSVFTNDAITWKIRHIYGGAWLDYRGGVANIVA